MTGWFPEEERSRQPSLFSVIRAIADLFRSDEPYLGLYGAFGYDLVFQFEKLEQRHVRPEDQRDCHLFLPTDLVVVDRQKELAYSICYRIYTPEGWTEPHLNTGATFPMASGRADEPYNAITTKVNLKRRCNRSVRVVSVATSLKSSSHKPSPLASTVLH